MTSYDYVIVGAGPAGCVLTSRLSQDPTFVRGNTNAATIMIDEKAADLVLDRAGA